MVIEQQILPFLEWLPSALMGFLLAIGGLSAIVLFVCFVVGAVQRGPMVAADGLFLAVRDGVEDIFRMSPRRVMALAGLAFQEAVRRRVLVAFAVFVVVLLFAVWFLDTDSPDPMKLYLGFVMTASTYLVLLLALFLSVFSLPNDIAKRTIYTIVTKPVRASEIVLGRMLGFTAIGSILLAIMAVVSYVFVTRQLDHQHEVDVASLVEVDTSDSTEANPIVKRGRTTNVQGHRHLLSIRKDGTGETDTVQSHWHEISTETVGGKTRYVVGPPTGMLTARVPIYGKLHFRSRTGEDSMTADNVGNEWVYRQFVEGGTPAAAIWNFVGVRETDFEDGLPLQMTLAVFRTHKGNIERPVLGSVSLRNPKTGLQSHEINFSSKEYNILEQHVPRKLQDKQNNPIDLFKDLVGEQGELEVHISCVDPGQYFGAAQPDLYLLAKENAFRPNFVKGYIGIWLQMVLITGMGVMFSTFLNGPVAMLATLASLIGGLFVKPMAELLSGQTDGGLMFESLYRMVSHAPMTTDLDPGIGATVIKVLDAPVALALHVIVALLPDLPEFSDVDYVAYGFDIPYNNLAVHAATALAYLVPLFVAGYFFLKTREVAK